MTKISVSYPEHTDYSGYLDIFAFDNDMLMQLDSYMHCESFSERSLHFRSQYGEKTIFVCANGQRDIINWATVNSIESLNEVYVELSKERKESLCMTGIGEASAGSDETCFIDMKRMASEVIIRSLSFDFSGKSYEGIKVHDLKAYLTNVNTRCSITAEGDIMPLSIINAGRFEPGDIENFIQQDMIIQNIPADIGNTPCILDLKFLCYPNASRTEGPGTPFTRLVIEGTMNGNTCWWPIDINRYPDSEKPGIHRNTQYIFDIRLTGKGSSDPDTPLEKENADIKMEIRKWNEKEDHIVRF